MESFRPASIHVFASNVTMHGFYHIFARHHSVIRRFAWSLAFLASLTLLILQSSNRVRYYLERPHVTKLDEISVLGLYHSDYWINDEIDYEPFPKVEYWHFQLLQSAIWMSFVSMSLQRMICKMNFIWFLTGKYLRYYAGEFIGFLDDKRQLHPAAIPPEDIENPEEYKKVLARLEQLSDFGPSFQPMANFSLFEFYNRTGIQLNELLLG